jgi:hypothetical protein
MILKSIEDSVVSPIKIRTYVKLKVFGFIKIAVREENWPHINIIVAVIQF